MGAALSTWYQNVDGVDGAVFKNPRRKHSRFWGEGKWNNFVKPLLPCLPTGGPAERRVFVEIGCNAGLFLKLAMDEGFENVIGVDSSRQRMGQAEQFRASNGYSYRLIHQKVGEGFDLQALPLADVTLLANVHYYLSIPVFVNLVDRLRVRSLYCIVVSARVRRRSGMAVHYLEAVRGYFRDWEEIKVVGDWQGLKPVDTLDDPAPRGQMYGVVFKGCLDSLDVKQECERRDRAGVRGKKQWRAGRAMAMRDFFRRVLDGEEFDFKETDLYKCWETEGWLPEDIEKRLAYNKSLLEDIQRDGMREPLYYDGKGKLLDGGHRLNIACALGYKHVLVRRL